MSRELRTMISELSAAALDWELANVRDYTSAFARALQVEWQERYERAAQSAA